MSIEWFAGVEGPTIVVQDANELYRALDILHTQVIDNLGGDSPYLPVLENTMEEVGRLLEGVSDGDHR